MPNPYFQLKQFTIHHDRCAMKVTTDACLFGAWVAEELRLQNNGAKTLLDIGAGTGLLSLMVAQKTEMQITAVEIDPEAAEQAAENVASSPWKEKISLIQEDIRTLSAKKKWDIIISNPPFYESQLTSIHKAKNTAHHSSQLTLKEVCLFIKKNITEGGSFFLLLPYNRLVEAEELVKAGGLHLQELVLVKQSYHHPPFRVLLKGTNQSSKHNVSTLSVWDDQQQYTGEFRSLLKDYYLYL